MSLSASLRFVYVLLVALWGSSCFIEAVPFNASMEGSGNEPELIFPIARTTHVPPSPSTSPNITTTFIRIKDFIFNQVVDFLKENLLLIIVVTSLLVVIIFIVCCASAMSHKRKLEAYYPPKTYAPRKYMSQPNRAMEKPQQTKPQNQIQDVKMTASNTHREPSKALVGEKEGKDPRPRLKEVQKMEDVEEVEIQKDDTKKREEPQPSTSNATSSQPQVCTCHLRKANPSTA
ncbi:transmembrane protein 119-like [Myxocyprinus asiaticus]|uniref:transmembrane protein 119-like n=1 Tax=Myxocyprinus asiaticus TaxID=70543 RepID=UPI002221F1B2|nr:transmembrane protein 119-like [Myxocyprinus asiaticus]